MIYLAILGLGTVGSGVHEVLKEKERTVAVQVKAILDIKDFPNHEDQTLFVDHFDHILADKEIQIVVETMGGLHPAYEYTKRALEAGKYVITSNKELVSECGNELTKIAECHGVNYLYEASVGGGIPIVRPLNQSLAGEKISEIFGILNGTTNYILTQMKRNGETFEKALADAQTKGYAELDPTNDIEGYDTKRKIKILAQLAFGKDVPLDEIQTTGIADISLADIYQAEAAGCALKLIGHAKQLANGEVTCTVKPQAIPKENPLYGIEDVFNGVHVLAEPIGEVMFYGRGAGKFPTASAILADILEVVREVS
ncbi:MAG: homoserine dehydrogenase [Turicibacter sp.]|nr:homoserine dehydrogenase [Turicibacter sp.]